MVSSPNPSYQGTLMELYDGRRRQRGSSSPVNGAIVHGNGSPFGSPSQHRQIPSPPPARTIGSNSNNDEINAKGKKESPSSKNKKKKGSSYHFIPMVGKHRSHESDEDSDDGYDAKQPTQSSNIGKRGTSTSTASDQDLLRDVFMNADRPTMSDEQINRNETSRGGESSTGEKTKKPADPLHCNTGRDDMVERRSDDKNPFTSPLGQRIWRQYQDQLGEGQTQQYDTGQSDSTRQTTRQPQHLSSQNNQHQQDQPTASTELSYRHLPSPDFLRLPTNVVQIRSSSSSKMEWANIDDLERNVIQHHLDMETSGQLGESPLMVDEHKVKRELTSGFPSSLIDSECFTRVIKRDSRLGLGMSLREYDGCVYIQECNAAGPASKAGLLAGDRLLGLNGHPFLKGRLASFPPTNGKHAGQGPFSSEEVLKSIGEALSAAMSPLALHMQRHADRESILSILRTLQNDYKEKNVSITNGPVSQRANATRAPKTPANMRRNAMPEPKGPIVHPFAKALSERKLIKKGKEELLVTQQLRSFTDRTRQWESKLSFRLRASDYALRPLLDARDVEPTYYASFLTDDGECPPFFDYKFSKSLRSYAPSTPMIQDWRLSRPGGEMASPARRKGQRLSREEAIMADLYAGLDEDDADVQDLILGGRSRASSVASDGGGGGTAYPAAFARAMTDPSDVFVPLVAVRKAICVRILNSFLDNRNRTAFTIWCYDVESGMEWYAPVRYYKDFQDLRSALMRVDKTIGDIPFPSMGWSLSFASEAKESAKTKEARRSQLESFLRKVFAGVYRGRLHPHLAEVAVHLQTFVGCDTVVGEGADTSLSLSKQVAISEGSYGKRTPDPKSEPDNNAQMHLKRSIMRYCYRLFLLPSVEELISQFVKAAMEKVMSEALGPSTRQSHQFAVNKDEATKDVEKIRDFIDQVQELILEGSRDDFLSISQRRDFAALVDDFDGSVLDNLFREAVREQTEIEVYVPLRSTISKYLVYAWFNEDCEMKHKLNALVDKPQSYFRIPKEHRSRSDWKSVSRILQDGVGRSTLPCVKLRAVVDAAKEISQLDSEERSVFPDASFFDGPKATPKTKILGADDFLPIFIYCFVQAKIERPSALCELLSLMCPSAKMRGETGYHLASFQAALTYIHELDLTEAENDLSLIFDT